MGSNLPYDEKDILLRVSQGEELAFTQLFNAWQPLLASYIFRITRSKELTAEVVQDVFLKIWMSREALVSVENFKAYLFIVSKNHALNALRKTMRELRNLKIWEKQVIIQDTDVIARQENETAFNDSSVYTLIDEAIEHLPPRQKQVFLLHRYERLTYNEIAIKLGIGKESVKTHIAFAVKTISKYLTARITLLITFVSNI